MTSRVNDPRVLTQQTSIQTCRPCPPNEQCVICQEPLTDSSPESTDDEAVSTKSCGHLFHRGCIAAWFASNTPALNSCPSCRCLLWGIVRIEQTPVHLPRFAEFPGHDVEDHDPGDEVFSTRWQNFGAAATELDASFGARRRRVGNGDGDDGDELPYPYYLFEFEAENGDDHIASVLGVSRIALDNALDILAGGNARGPPPVPARRRDRAAVFEEDSGEPAGSDPFIDPRIVDLFDPNDDDEDFEIASSSQSDDDDLTTSPRAFRPLELTPESLEHEVEEEVEDERGEPMEDVEFWPGVPQLPDRDDDGFSRLGRRFPP
ncbi:hypothetical protein N0V83_003108 [Neocucurbitaria cava]|uniref:RING-type domain-containing protein n=1 Tax=Neocucurbitaria cava TaxID=798079 RepID=A0A9W8YG77_9PLEO|nr:hypothetical protein N0V83_003108 [Neocucurbitaria cava]